MSTRSLPNNTIYISDSVTEGLPKEGRVDEFCFQMNYRFKETLLKKKIKFENIKKIIISRQDYKHFLLELK